SFFTSSPRMNFCESTTRTISARTSSRICLCCARRSSKGICFSLTGFTYSSPLSVGRRNLFSRLRIFRSARLAHVPPFGAKFHADTASAHPAPHPRGISVNQGVIRHVARHHRTRPHKCVPADRRPANYGAVGTQ